MSRISKFSEFSKNSISEAATEDIRSKAKKKMQYCRIQLLRGNPFFGHLGYKLNFIERLDLPFKTMATDGMNIYYDPGFVVEKPLDEITWVICHEIMHCVLFHFARKMPNARIWNAACDYALNHLIDPELSINQGKALGKMPEEALGGKKDTNPHKDKLKGMKAEDIYQFLIENPDVLPPEEGWNYGEVVPPKFVKPGGSDGESEEGGGKKVKVGDWVRINSGGYGIVQGIDPSTGDVDIQPATIDQLKAQAEARRGRKIKSIK
jgi:hypothetical protein